MKTSHTNPRFGCGNLTNVEGTNGGKMPCGSMLHYPNGKSEIYYCVKCDRLIAAAPDMLRALEAAKISLIGDEHYHEFKTVINTIEQAIAKAKGE